MGLFNFLKKDKKEDQDKEDQNIVDEGNQKQTQKD